jgi:hypothetical protein
MFMNKPKQFDKLYQCTIESSKKIVQKPFDPMSYPYPDPNSPARFQEEVIEFVNIKMPREVYERFNQNWEQYLTLMAVARDNPRINEEYHKLLMMTNLLA